MLSKLKTCFELSEEIRNIMDSIATIPSIKTSVLLIRPFSRAKVNRTPGKEKMNRIFEYNPKIKIIRK
jgi:hypothetical protein